MMSAKQEEQQWLWGQTVVVSQAPQSFGEDLFMHQSLNDIILQLLRQEGIDHMLLLPGLPS